MSELKVGIVGLGGIARKHCGAIEKLDNVKVVAVADLIKEKCDEYVGKYDVPKAYNHHSELIKDDEIDAVAIVLGHQLHHRLTVDALNAGKHVLVEKPMAINLEQCDNMIAAADANNVKLMVGYSQHYYGTSLKAKEILDSGELGPPITAVCYMSKNWNYKGRRPQYRSRYHGGGMWLTNGTHVVDRLTWIMGSQAYSVSANIGTRAHYQAADDSATAFIRYKNGLSGVAVAVGYADGGPNHECHVICANGSLRFSQHSEKFVKIGKGEKWEDVPFDDPEEEFHHEWKSFAEAIEQNIEPPTHGHWGRHIMEIMFAAEQSAITGKEVLLESAHTYETQQSGTRVNTEHGWI
ncbi:MAG: Gfo/Idh/MocA family oxidoreductase [Candidatus Latescibacteria bacterium]|jgi:predicted dehydrogenase|nr:Gfo/Idh/MocA family oxidoreductase [Candidatus Latescibacterota bacterium]